MTKDQPVRSLGFIGLGVMGAGICRNIATKSGLPMSIWDASAEALQVAKATAGCTARESIADVVGNADLVCLCLPGGPQLDAVCRGDGGLIGRARAGQVIVDHTTAPVGLTRELAACFADKGVRYADAPVARGREAADQGTLSIYVGCEEALYPTLKLLLGYAGTDVTRCGDVGAGQIVKLLNNMVLFQTVMALAEALVLARGAGLDGRTLFEALQSGAADSYALRNHGMKSLLPEEFPLRAFPSTYALKDLIYAIEMGRDENIELFGAKALEQLLRRSIELGYGEYYYPAFLSVLTSRPQKEL